MQQVLERLALLSKGGALGQKWPRPLPRLAVISTGAPTPIETRVPRQRTVRIFDAHLWTAVSQSSKLLSGVGTSGDVVGHVVIRGSPSPRMVRVGLVESRTDPNPLETGLRGRNRADFGTVRPRVQIPGPRPILPPRPESREGRGPAAPPLARCQMTSRSVWTGTGLTRMSRTGEVSCTY